MLLEASPATKSGTTVEWVLTEEFLMDLPATPGYADTVQAFLEQVAKRFRNWAPNEYYCQNGTVVSIEIEWPVERYRNTTRTYLVATVQNLGTGGLRRAAILMGDAERFQANPFLRIEAVVNGIRRSIDSGKFRFYSLSEQPEALEMVEGELAWGETNVTAASELEKFIRGKVLHLGFARGDRTTYVWIADPFDAAYLGTKPADLIRVAQVVEAKGFIALGLEGEFGRPADRLLLTEGKEQDDSVSRRSGRLDPLTQLLDKGEFQQDVIGLCGEASTARPLSLIMLDIDHFKAINDNHGHPAGDKVLMSLATTLRNVVERKGQCYRYGGEELAVLLPNTSSDEARVLAERIRVELYKGEMPVPQRVTASFGVATSVGKHTPEQLVKGADNALYAAKHGGRNQVQVARGEADSAPLGSPVQAFSEAAVVLTITSSYVQNLTLTIRNDSQEALSIKGIALGSPPYQLTPILRPKTDGEWDAPAGSKRSITLQLPDLVGKLAELVGDGKPRQADFIASLEFVLDCRISGLPRELRKFVKVQVSVSHLSIRQLSSP